MQTVLERVLPAEARSVSAARNLVREALTASGHETRADDAALAVSELATNAVVHVGAAFRLTVLTSSRGARIELHDCSPTLPVTRQFAETAGTGRGLRIVQESVDRWGAEARPTGKIVWIELGDVAGWSPTPLDDFASPAEPGASVAVTLLDTPLLMHMAWQEHAQALLREYLLSRIDEDAHVLEQHAATSEALALLYAQIPQPTLPEDPDALLAETLEPDVTAPELRLDVPSALVDNFAVLSLLLSRAVEAARGEEFLAPPTQPEIEEMREWLCHEVMRQAAGHGQPRPWHTSADSAAPLQDPQELHRRYEAVLHTSGDVIVTDESSVIVAVSPTVADFLGYAGPAELLGRRIIVVVPERYHQAHIAGTTLNATNGRDKLLGVRIEVPVVRADDTEVLVELEVRARQVEGERIFVADMTLPRTAIPTG